MSAVAERKLLTIAPMMMMILHDLEASDATLWMLARRSGLKKM